MPRRYTLEYGLGAQDGVKRPFLQLHTSQKKLVQVHTSQKKFLLVHISQKISAGTLPVKKILPGKYQSKVQRMVVWNKTRQYSQKSKNIKQL